MPRLLVTTAAALACWVHFPLACPGQVPPRKLAPPQTIPLTTDDQLVVQCVYYPGIEDKNTVPVILLHGWDGLRGPGSGRDFDSLAVLLQQAGHAVIVPDLRGFGKSTRRRVVSGTRQALTRDRLRSKDVANMVRFDVEAVKRFLITKHNEGKLNIELLCLVGADMGAVVAVNFAARDWSWPSLPTVKQGQDVRALVLISPPQAFKGVSVQKALDFEPIREMSTLIVYGEQDKDAARDAERLYNAVERFHPEPATREAAAGNQSLFLVGLNTSLQGTKLLQASLETAKKIEQFVTLRLVNRRERYPWRERSRD